MAYLKRAFRMAGFLAVVFCALLPPGCSSESTDSGPLNTCSRVVGVWNVALDYGNGLVQHQTWTILQNECELKLTGDPADTNGPALDATPQSGFAREAWFRASWVKTVQPCRWTSVIEATVDGNTFTGDMLWIKNDDGGYCGSGSGNATVTGSR